MKRDIVQFVEFKKFKNNPIVLRTNVCEEIPTQVIDFYKYKNIIPNELS